MSILRDEDGEEISICRPFRWLRRTFAGNGTGWFYTFVRRAIVDRYYSNGCGMKMKSQLQEYFRRFIVDVQGLKASTAKHYIQALSTCSRILRSKKLVATDVYAIDTLTELKSLQDKLFVLPEFVALNTRGNHMYSVGMNQYVQFAELQVDGVVKSSKKIALPIVDISKLDIPVAPPKSLPKIQSYQWNRDRIIVEQVLQADKYLCEVNSNHKTFVARRNAQPYLEGHHIIPLSRQKEFNVSLDVYANIIGLCPTCHRQLHFGKQSEIRKILKPVYDLRAERFVKSGIAISKDEFLAIAAG